jgi:hypothetical protein
VTAIITDLDAAMDAWDARTDPEARRRGRIRDSVFAGHRARALANPRITNLQRVRLNFRGEGLTVEQLSERSTVSPRVIRRAEAREPISDASWLRLSRALDVQRSVIDPGYVSR